MSTHPRVAVLAAFAILAACGRSGNMPSAGSIDSAASSATTPMSVVTTGNFTEYSLPAGVHPADLTRGPYATLYFVGNVTKLYQMQDASGQVHTFTLPPPYNTWGTAIISNSRSVQFTVVDHTIPEDGFSFAHVTPEGVFSFTGAPYLEFMPPINFALGADGNVWYGYCVDPCGGPDNGLVEPHSTSLGDFFIAEWLTPGPGSNMYVAARNQGPPVSPPATDSRVYVLSLSGAILRTLSLPLGSNPAGIANGSDHNLWVTEPGINKIARVTPTGTVTQFTLPNANAGPNRIVAGYDSALFFTETNANRIGRITTAGAIASYAIPSANSGASGIAPCSSANCGTHGGVWFTETNANKIGRFNAPI